MSKFGLTTEHSSACLVSVSAQLGLRIKTFKIECRPEGYDGASASGVHQSRGSPIILDRWIMQEVTHPQLDALVVKIILLHII